MKKIQYLSDEEYGTVFKKVPRICLDFIILNDENDFLLTKRKIEPYKNFWHFPGGRIFYKETIKKAINRIIKTELGIKIDNFNFVGYMEFINDGPYVHSISMVFIIKVSDNIINTLKINGQAFCFEFFNKVPNKMHPIHKNFLIKNKFI